MSASVGWILIRVTKVVEAEDNKCREMGLPKHWVGLESTIVLGGMFGGRNAGILKQKPRGVE